ncbi:serine/threonine/tyrosine-interacting-like protein 1 isoform X3 [Equus przewalskii]|uniref:Serine/threonine/tyrosine-interacting-like protein 1 isoform X3 n=2 Tax=Equus przewalskii TaxID=9798 RepID=A0ABM2FCY8_EQUPR|nr:PREDICTED: serine/threonine/tyrosine-interacting-like protein 1 isoform X1 [Equus przewalskii]
MMTKGLAGGYGAKMKFCNGYFLCAQVLMMSYSPDPTPSSWTYRMADLVLCEPIELYNILNQVTKLSRLTEPNYLCLLDVRSKREYDESHVITARRVKKKANEYLIPESVDLECVKYCVVYDNNTSFLEILRHSSDDDVSDESREGPVLGAAIKCGKALTHLTRHPVRILKGGYERFSAMYHFFRTQKIIWMPQELDAFQPYPVEIMPGKIYLGNFRQACDPKIQKDLKIKAHVNVSMETGPFFTGDADKLLHIQIEDSPEANISPFLRHVCHFVEVLGLCQEVPKQHVSKSGLGDSAVGVGEDRPWRLGHRHQGSLLIFSVAQLWVLKNLGWGHVVYSGPKAVTRLLWKEKASAARNLMSASCSGSSQAPPSHHTAGAVCSDSATAPIPGAFWTTPTALHSPRPLHS